MISSLPDGESVIRYRTLVIVVYRKIGFLSDLYFVFLSFFVVYFIEEVGGF